jgi:hypothetical protein
MTLALSLSIRLFIAAVLLMLAASFIYRCFRSISTDRTYWDELVTSCRGRPKVAIHPEAPPEGIFLSVVHHCSTGLDSAREQLHFLVEYLQANLAGQNFEILCFAQPCLTASVGGLHRQFPQARFLAALDDLPSIRAFTFATLRARGTFIIDGSQIEAELPKLPPATDRHYISAINPMPDRPYVAEPDALVLVAASRWAAVQLVRNLHVTEFGIAAEIRFIAHEKGLRLCIEDKKMECDHAASYWLINNAVSALIPLLYKRTIWTLRDR